MKRSKYLVKKKPVAPKAKAKLVSPKAKPVLKKAISSPKVVVRKMTNPEKKESDFSSSSEEIVKKLPELSPAGERLATEIIMALDPDQEMEKKEMIAVLQRELDKSDDFVEIEALGYLITSFENMEEKLVELEENRDEQEGTILSKQRRWGRKDFKEKISLDSDEKLQVDESVAIFEKTKKVYGSQSRYAKPKSDEVKKFKAAKALKKINQKVRSKYRL